VIHQGQKKAFNEANLKLSEDILEDIKGLIIEFLRRKNFRIFILVRCCFVSPFARAQIYAKNKLGFDESFKEASSVNYPLGPETIIRIPGLVR
jgi:hypothetical protein